MTRRITVTARARTDLAQARLRYLQIRPDLAREFSDDVDRTMQAIRERPESFPPAEYDVRRALCGRFPYKLYFTIKPEEVRVLAAYHVSRDPRRWRNRG